MVMSGVKTAQGYITVVQEDRFRLMTDGGQGFLLTLARDARTSAADLCHLHDIHAHVAITYSGEPNLASGIAHAIRALDQ